MIEDAFAQDAESERVIFRAAAEFTAIARPHQGVKLRRSDCCRGAAFLHDHVVMVIEELMPRECRALIARSHHARLACSMNNQPYIVPVHVDLEGPFLYGFSTLGQKIEWMRQNPLVCLEFDETTTEKEWSTVVVYGVYEELPQTSEFAYPRFIAENLFQKRPRWWEPAAVPLIGHQRRSPILFRIIISRLTGRRARQESEDATGPQPTRPSRLQWLTAMLRPRTIS